MKASELIAELAKTISDIGDSEVYYGTGDDDKQKINNSIRIGRRTGECYILLY